jgi:hypothetical protein
MQRNYCSVLSAASTDHLFASAPVFDRLLLLEYNHAWGEHPLTENKLGAAVNLFLENCITQNVFSRLMFIKNRSITTGRINLFAVNCRDDAPFTKRFILHDYAEIMEMGMEVCFSETDENRFNEPIYLVCTHGKVDVCCSKFGIPVFKALSELDANTWQATHVTGDRFAPNVVQLPYGHYYGWLNINEMTGFYETIHSGHIFMEKYRGRPCHTKGEQAADFFLRKELDERSANALKFVNTEIIEGNTSITRFCHQPTGREYAVYYNTEKSNDKYFMNCKADEAVAVDQYKLTRIALI